MNKDAMNQGVQILLERMDTNPEEFDDYAGKWGDIIGAVHARKSIPEEHRKDAPLPFLTDPEVNALYEKLEDVRRENFTSDVLRRLADTPKEIAQQELWDTSYSSSNHPVLGTPPSLTTTLPYTTGTSINLSEREKQQLREALEDYNDKINLKEHERLHREFGLAVKAGAVKADRKKATPR
jgi:hypothetical protein